MAVIKISAESLNAFKAQAPQMHELSEEAAAVVAKIQASPRPVVLFDLCADMYEVATAPNADGLHKWQRLTATGIHSQGCDTLPTIAQMIAGE